ncbi:MAG: YfhO family protein [Chloroflexi bacterium]|nr:YfhO family protein [Chloroflexota bacterium]
MWPVWVSAAPMSGGDAVLTYLPRLYLLREALAAGSFPFWNPYTFNGVPAFPLPQAGLAYPLTWALVWLPPAVALNWSIGLHVLLAGLGAAWCAGRLGASREGQFLAGLAYGLGSATAARLWAGHVAFLAGNAWLPIVTGLAATIRRRWSVERFALALAMLTLAGQPELGAFCLWWTPLWAVAGVLVSRTDAPGRANSVVIRALGVALGRLGVGSALGLGLAAVLIVPAFGLLAASVRQGGAAWDFLTGMSEPPWHLLTLLGPTVFGGPAGRGYWPGPEYEWHERVLYVGIVPLLAALRARGRWRWPCWGAALLAGALAFGRYAPWYAWAQAVLPGYATMRVPAKHLTLVALALSRAAGLGLERWSGRRTAMTLFGAGVALLMAGPLVAFWLPGLAALAPTDASQGRTFDLAWGAPVRSAFPLAAGAMLLAGLTALLLPRWLALRVLSLFAALDLLFVFSPYRLNEWPLQQRIDSLAPIRAYGHVAVVGPAGPSVANFGPVIGVAQPLGYGSLFSTAYGQLTIGQAQPVVLGSDQVDNPVWPLLGVEAIFDSRLVLVRVVEAPKPPAWVARCVWPGDAATARRLDFPRDACVTHPSAAAPDPPVPPGDATVLSLGAGWLEARADGPGWLVTTLPWYAGWSAELDGQPASVELLDGALVGLFLPPGRHTVALHYRPAGLDIGLAITVASALLLLTSWMVARRPRSARS